MTKDAIRKLPPTGTTDGPRIGRRGFFGASLGLAAAGLAGGAALPAFGSELGDERTKTRYQADSDHVKKYYHVNQLVWPEGLQHAD